MQSKRKSFSQLKRLYPIPNLLEIQLNSFNDFIQSGVPKQKRKNIGLQEVFTSVFPIESYDKNYRLEFTGYSLSKPKYEIEDCKIRSMTYASGLKVKLRLKSSKDIKEQEVYIGDLPLMTPVGTFIINGDERVVVSQLHRSPGISFESSMHPNGKRIYTARFIPYRGAWLEFEFDAYDNLYVYIDRKKKVLSTVFLRALGFSTEEDILRLFSEIVELKSPTAQVLEQYVGSVTISDIIDEETGVTILQKKEKLTREIVKQITLAKVNKIRLIKDPIEEILNTLSKDHSRSTDDALTDIYRKLRPGDPATIENAKAALDNLFFDHKRYDLGSVGRFMLNKKLHMNVPLENRVLDRDTVVEGVKQLLYLRHTEAMTDDIDHLGNRRVRTIGELLANQFRIGFTRLERAIRERMSIYDLENIMPHNLINSKLVSSVIKDFFGRSQLSQFMDQTNPLAEMTHKRRVSALGPGGLSRERAGFEVRDVHYSHYGRVCPIETPEGPNIGLIASLSTYARVNEFGFIETPYVKVENGRATKKVEYLSADVEDTYYIAQANSKIDDEGRFIEDAVFCRYKSDFLKIEAKQVQYMDVSPTQLVSVAACLIPFLEHDDANRALMGSNMQRQAVPLLEPEEPLVGTGMESKVAQDSGAMVIAEAPGMVRNVQSDQIQIGERVYKLRKYQRSNASTCLNQRPLVALGQRVEAGDVIADGAATKNGELALGRNLLVAFMPWRGYNFEDAILISEKLVKDDIFTSIHIEEFEIEARDTRLGPEEITRDIPNIGEEALRDLDDEGIIRIGAEVGPGDVLVGKVMPKSETELSPEEKLLRAIFGEKAGDVRDASLTVPPGIEGVVVDVKVFSRKQHRPKKKEELTKELAQIDEVKQYYGSQIDTLEQERIHKLIKFLVGKKISSALLDEHTGSIIIASGKVIKKSDIKKMQKCDISSLKLHEEDIEAEEDIKRIIKILDEQIEELIYEEEREIDKIKRGDELPAGVLKKVTVNIASKRKASVGDKVAGRHGNKGVIAKILPEADMPYLADGTPVEMVLNPLGVPSRMNVGQIMETHLGWAARILGIKIATPVFDGATEDEIRAKMVKSGIPEDGKVALYDGFTGEPFAQKVTVGYIYMMKLAHLVDDKIHARSIGPYSLVTQQPLGGKAQFGGQRFGEMEVWALEAYGAAYTLQELLTVKSDDVMGRTRIYESIVKGENALQPGTPESFNVLVKELQSLCLDIRTESLKHKSAVEKK
ncbi:MAG: DNA-directed RNA polymerase subunit beta [Candidatus Omnitrophica bacterium]|nr:DNA-directed RNA polymerase subunit beta [Candidatus Omnitrophota bacterium]